jgi:hypothetical protein
MAEQEHRQGGNTTEAEGQTGGRHSEMERKKGRMELQCRTPDTRANTRADIEERWTDRDQDEMGSLRYGRELRERTDGRKPETHSRGNGKKQRRETPDRR